MTQPISSDTDSAKDFTPDYRPPWPTKEELESGEFGKILDEERPPK